MKPIRMCVSCRERFEQIFLIRLQCIEKNLFLYEGKGRSFYLCGNCIDSSNKIHSALCRQCKNNKKYELDLKEILINVRKSKSS